MLNWILIFALLGSPAIAKRKTDCSKRELDRKSCHLALQKYRFDFTPKNISLDNGTWRAVADLPLDRNNVQWESLKVKKFGKRLFVEWKVWDEPVTESHVQSLLWYVMEINETKVDLKLNRTLGKRRLISKEGEPKKYLKDKMEKHRLRAVGRKVHWSSGAAKGKF